MKPLPIKKFVFYFSELILTTAAYALLIWYFTSKNYLFGLYNREISWLILFLFVIGIGMVIYHLLNLSKEDTQIALFYQRLGNFKAALTQLLQKRSTEMPEAFSTNLRKTMDDHFAGLKPSLIKERVYRVATPNLITNTLVQETLAKLLQQREEVKGNRIRYLAEVLIAIGFLGAFFGLVQEFFTLSETTGFTPLFANMQQTLEKLGKIFGIGISGISAYLVLGYLLTVLRAKRSYLLNQIEVITLEHLIPTLQAVNEKQDNGISTNAIAVLRTIPQTVSDQINAALENILEHTISESSENLKATSVNFQLAAQGIQEGQATFTETLRALGDFLTPFQESTNQIQATRETLASGIKEFTQGLKILKKNQQTLTKTLKMTKEYMINSETRLSAIDEVVQQIHTVWSNNRQVFEDLAATIQNEHKTLAQVVQGVEEFLKTAQTESQTHLQQTQAGITTLINENTKINQELLTTHTMLTTLLTEIKTFIVDEQNGLRLLTSSMGETFGDARFQYLQLAEHLEALYKRVHESQEQLAQVQETTTAIQEQLQSKKIT